MAKENRGEQIRLDLTNRILGGALVPGERLDEQRIADHYQVSRTPVREVLQQLAASGLAEIKPRRGAFVKQLSRSEITDLFEAMGEMEAICARFAAQRMTDIERAGLAALVEEGEALAESGMGARYTALNLGFHQAIFDGAHNASLVEMAKILRLRTSPYRNAQFSDEQQDPRGEIKRLATSQQEHCIILAAIEARDGDAAQEAMKRHITASSANVLRIVEALIAN